MTERELYDTLIPSYWTTRRALGLPTPTTSLPQADKTTVQVKLSLPTWLITEIRRGDTSVARIINTWRARHGQERQPHHLRDGAEAADADGQAQPGDPRLQAQG